MSTQFPRFLTIEEAAQRLGVSVARVSMWIGECKLPVAARSEYAGFLLRSVIVQTVGDALAGALPPEARSGPLAEPLAPQSITCGRCASAACTADVGPSRSHIT
jgi:hypothetical protein